MPTLLKISNSCKVANSAPFCNNVWAQYDRKNHHVATDLSRPSELSLLQFKAHFGHCLVPSKYSANRTLGYWVLSQRKNYRWYREGKPSPMTAERSRELDGIGFDWGTGKADLTSIWSVRLQELCDFKSHFGHWRVPHKYSANLTLGHWVTSQRATYRLYQEGKPSSMTGERIRELDGIGFGWGKIDAFLIDQSVVFIQCNASGCCTQMESLSHITLYNKIMFRFVFD